MKLSENFTLEEFTYSRIATTNEIDNIPDEEQTENIRQLVIHLLQPLREYIGVPITISSGFRCREVNRLAGGVSNSQHIKGEAADCCVAEGADFLLKKLKESRLPFDQAILYKRRNFLHLSYGKSNRNEIITNETS